MMIASAVVVVAGLVAATPGHAGLSVELAKQCRALMLQAHPTHLYGRHGTAAIQRSYFHECVSRRGDMPEARQNNARRAPPSTTGQGYSADR